MPQADKPSGPAFQNSFTGVEEMHISFTGVKEMHISFTPAEGTTRFLLAGRPTVLPRCYVRLFEHKAMPLQHHLCEISRSPGRRLT